MACTQGTEGVCLCACTQGTDGVYVCMCVCVYACTQGTDDGKTAQALQAAFEEASRFAPCVLMLQHLEVLTSAKGEQSTEG